MTTSSLLKGNHIIAIVLQNKPLTIKVNKPRESIKMADTSLDLYIVIKYSRGAYFVRDYCHIEFTKGTITERFAKIDIFVEWYIFLCCRPLGLRHIAPGN